MPPTGSWSTMYPCVGLFLLFFKQVPIVSPSKFISDNTGFGQGCPFGLRHPKLLYYAFANRVFRVSTSEFPAIIYSFQVTPSEIALLCFHQPNFLAYHRQVPRNYLFRSHYATQFCFTVLPLTEFFELPQASSLQLFVPFESHHLILHYCASVNRVCLVTLSEFLVIICSILVSFTPTEFFGLSPASSPQLFFLFEFVLLSFSQSIFLGYHKQLPCNNLFFF